MKLSKQIKSLDRRFAPYRQRSTLLNKLYNHVLGINVTHSFHNEEKKNELMEEAKIALDVLLSPTESKSNLTEIPKIIWMFWDSGFDNAPEVVKLSVKSWQKMNPDYEVKLLTDESLKELLGFDFNAIFQLSSVHCLPAIKADLIRLYLLSKYGGIWADATTFCLKPLSKWLDTANKCCNLLTFKHKNNPSRPVEVWFIASPRSASVINNTLIQLVSYIFAEREYTLFISGKVSLLNKVFIDYNAPQDVKTMERAELLGFMPYFSTGYSIYSSMESINPIELNEYLNSCDRNASQNRYALTNDTFEVYQHALVSKQTYINSYLSSDVYKSRRDFLLNKLNA
ncbi:capsular polysaccharide synthesis protein [Aliivibrio logei]|nr:capsular polysaccharide synthesis protein [Aliivibrio logei]